MPSIPLPAICAPTLTAKARHSFNASPATLYDAWTTGFELWFAQPGTLSMEPQEGRAWFFYNRDDWGRHPHYGRFLQLKPHKMVETTWLTGNGKQEGTVGAETVLRIDLIPAATIRSAAAWAADGGVVMMPISMARVLTSIAIFATSSCCAKSAG